MKQLLKIVSFLVVFVILFAYVDSVFSFKQRNDMLSATHTINGLYAEPDNSLDVLFVGSSHVYSGVNPHIIWDNFGIPSYVYSGQSQIPEISYHYIIEALKSQHPKMIALEVYKFIRPGISDAYLRTNVDNMKMSKNKLQLINEVVPSDKRFAFLFGFTKYHSKWKELQEDDFTYMFEDKTNSQRGFRIDFRRSSQKPAEPQNETTREPIDTNGEDYLNKIIALAKVNNIELLLFAAPMANVPPDYQRKLNYIQDIATRNGLEYLNYNAIRDVIGIDSETDFRDTAHLNCYGAKKVSLHLGQLLQEKYHLTSKKNDQRYAYLDEHSKYYHHREFEFNLVNTKKTDEYLRLVNQTDDLVVIGAYQNILKLKDPSLEAQFETLYFPSGEIAKKNLVFIRDGEDITYQHQFKKDINYKTKLGGKPLRITNVDNGVIVRLDHTNYSKNQDGLNLMIYDPHLGAIIDSVNISLKGKLSR